MPDVRAPELPVGLEGFTFPELDPFALLDLAARTGYSHIGVRLIDPATNTPTLTPGEARRLRLQAREQGLLLHGGDILDLAGIDPTGHGGSLYACLAVFAACGITRMGVFYRDSDLPAARGLFRGVVARSRAYGVTPYLEPVSYFGLGSLTAVAELVTNAKGGGLTLDTLHFGRAQEDLAVLAEIVRRIPVWLQVCDGPPLDEIVPTNATPAERTAALRHESVARRLPPGAGVCGVADIVRTVREHAPASDLVLMVEAPDHERVARIGVSAHASACREAATRVMPQPFDAGAIRPWGGSAGRWPGSRQGTGRSPRSMQPLRPGLDTPCGESHAHLYVHAGCPASLNPTKPPSAQFQTDPGP